MIERLIRVGVDIKKFVVGESGIETSFDDGQVSCALLFRAAFICNHACGTGVAAYC